MEANHVIIEQILNEENMQFRIEN